MPIISPHSEVRRREREPPRRATYGEQPVERGSSTKSKTRFSKVVEVAPPHLHFFFCLRHAIARPRDALAARDWRPGLVAFVSTSLHPVQGVVSQDGVQPCRYATTARHYRLGTRVWAWVRRLNILRGKQTALCAEINKLKGVYVAWALAMCLARFVPAIEMPTRASQLRHAFTYHHMRDTSALSHLIDVNVHARGIVRS